MAESSASELRQQEDPSTDSRSKDDLTLLLVISLALAARPQNLNHRRRIYTEENAKVVAAVWGTEFIKFLAALGIMI